MRESSSSWEARVRRGLAVTCVVAVTAGCGDATHEAVGRARQAATTPRQVVPLINATLKARLRSVYLAGQSAGNRAAVFSKVGDSITTSRYFLQDIGCGSETLGAFTGLAPTISYFRATSLTGRSTVRCSTVNSFNLNSLAAGSKWTVTSALARVNRSDCPSPYNTNLRCEYRVTRPSIALVELGTYDLEKSATVTSFQSGLTQVVTDSIAAGVIPVLSTIPPRTDNATYGARVAAYNDAILAVAAAQQVPVWDYWLAMTSPGMVNQGLATDGVLPSVYNGNRPADFTTAALGYGFNQRNLTALQALEHVRAVVIDDGAPDTEPTPDAGTDATTDTGTDAAVDAATDITDAGLDAATDTADAATDTTTDTATDAATDASDAGTDGGAATRVILPVIDEAMKARLRTLFLAGQSSGNRAAVFSKIGDSITISGSFLTDIGCNSENLGTFTALAPTINYFRATTLPGRSSVWCGVSNSFSLNSIAADSGWTTASLLAPISRADCPSPDNTNLRCELRLTRPSIALVMIGTNDLERINNITTYTNNLTQVVDDILAAGVIPVLSTIPPRFDSTTLGARVADYNNAIMSVARARQIPLWDYWLALQNTNLVNGGMDPDGIHPNLYGGQYACDFTTTGLRYGYNQRNLTAAQVLEHVKAVVLDNGPADP